MNDTFLSLLSVERIERKPNIPKRNNPLKMINIGINGIIREILIFVYKKIEITPINPPNVSKVLVFFTAIQLII